MLTARQQEIWQFLVEYADGHGYPPTVREIGEAVGLASPSKGHANIEEVPRLPLLGQIAAGAPLLAEENVEDHIAVPAPLGRGADFLLNVRGDSMIEAGILDGDTLVVRKQEDAANGDVVVALVGDDEGANEATVKTFYRESGRIRLQPENSALEPIYADHGHVLCKVVGEFPD